MVAFRDKKTDEGAAEVAFPGDVGLVGNDSVEGAGVEEEDDNGGDGGAPAFHPPTSGDEVGDQAIDDGAGADVDGVAASDEPRAEAAAEPDEEEGFFGAIFAI